jgi:diguanylate cyclase (GGDEF)-like protein
MFPGNDPLTAILLVISVVVQLAAALVAVGQMRLVVRYRYAWLAISLALTLMVQRRIASLVALPQGGGDQYSSALVGLLISLLMLAGVLGLRALLADMRRQERELVRLATTDALTQVHNRRHALELARRELVRQQRTGRHLALLVLDLDHFKSVNDTHGHAAGDTVLAGVSAAGREALRAMDIFGRLGGEEFVVVLPETDRSQAIASAERLRTRIAALVIPAGEAGIRITVSIGIAVDGALGRDPDAALTELLRRADAALYAAKSAGRDRCVVWNPSLGERKQQPAGDPPPASP